LRDMCSTVENYFILRVFTTGSKIRNFLRDLNPPFYIYPFESFMILDLTYHTGVKGTLY